MKYIRQPGFLLLSFPATNDEYMYSVGRNDGNVKHQLCLMFCRFDHLDISNPAQSKRFCGNHTGETYLVKGNYANINFVTDVSVTKAGYDLYFIFVDPRKYE